MSTPGYGAADWKALNEKYAANPDYVAEQQQMLADARGINLDESMGYEKVTNKFGERINEIVNQPYKNRASMDGGVGFNIYSKEEQDARNAGFSKWYKGFEENYDNPFIQGGNFTVEHYSSDRKLAEMLRDAKVGDPIPVNARAKFLSPIIAQSGLKTVTPELQKFGEQFIFAGDAGYVEDAPDTSGGWIKDNLGS